MLSIKPVAKLEHAALAMRERVQAAVSP
jgi:hypothetical protein